MINYNEMEKVIQDLNNYVEKIQKTTESQKRIDESVEQLEKIKESIKEFANNVKQYTDSLQGIESKHETLITQFDTVLQDYRKLHSAFELIDIELKKISVNNENFEKKLLETKSELEKLTNITTCGFNSTQEAINEKSSLFEKQLLETKSELENIKSSQKLILTNQYNAVKKNKIWFGVLTGFASAILLLTIIGFFL